MAGTLSTVLNAVLTTTDTSIAPSPTIITRNLNNPTFLATTDFFQSGIQVVNPTTTVITLPAATVYVVYVKHVGNANNLTVTFTPSGGAPETVVLQPGGVFLYFQPSNTAGGITALSLSASAATVVAEVYVAG